MQAEWERAVIKYEQVEGADKLSKDMLVTTYMAILPDKVAEHLRVLDTEFDNIEDVKAYVRKQINAHASPIGEIEPVPMDMGNLNLETSDDSSANSKDDKKDDKEKHDHKEYSDEEWTTHIFSMISGGKGIPGQG